MNFVRKMFWADFTGGGHANFYDFTWWRGSGRTVNEGHPSQPPPREILNAAKFLRRFVEEGNVSLWMMTPHDEFIVGNGLRAVPPTRAREHPFVFAQPGAVYVVYLTTGGGFTLDLSADAGTFTTAYCLANPGKEYLIYLPDGGEVTVDLSHGKGTFVVGWGHPVEGTLTPGGMTSGGTRQTFTAPFRGDAILSISRR